MIFRTFSFALMTSTKDAKLSLTSGSEKSLSTPNEFSGMSFSISLSLLMSSFKSVWAIASVRRRRVTSTSRSPSTTSAPRSIPSRMVTTNSSPALNPLLSSFLYMPLMAFPTPAVATRITGFGLVLLDGDGGEDELIVVVADCPPFSIAREGDDTTCT